MLNFRKLSDSFDMECINDSHDGVGGQYSVQTVLYMYSVHSALLSTLVALSSTILSQQALAQLATFRHKLLSLIPI